MSRVWARVEESSGFAVCETCMIEDREIRSIPNYEWIEMSNDECVRWKSKGYLGSITETETLHYMVCTCKLTGKCIRHQATWEKLVQCTFCCDFSVRLTAGVVGPVAELSREHGCGRWPNATPCTIH